MKGKKMKMIELQNCREQKEVGKRKRVQQGAFYLFIAEFFATQIIGDAKELVVLL